MAAPIMQRLRVPGHALSMTWSGERGEESSSTGTCRCGRWSESGSSQLVVREEYRHHLWRMRADRAAAQEAAARAEANGLPASAQQLRRWAG